MEIPHQLHKLKKGRTYKLRYVDENNYFYGFFVCIDRGFLCFNHAGQIIACRPESIEIIM